jgi:hypothetical protein
MVGVDRGQCNFAFLLRLLPKQMTFSEWCQGFGISFDVLVVLDLIFTNFLIGSCWHHHQN